MGLSISLKWFLFSLTLDYSRNFRPFSFPSRLYPCFSGLLFISATTIISFYCNWSPLYRIQESQTKRTRRYSCWYLRGTGKDFTYRRGLPTTSGVNPVGGVLLSAPSLWIGRINVQTLGFRHTLVSHHW